MTVTKGALSVLPIELTGLIVKQVNGNTVTPIPVGSQSFDVKCDYDYIVSANGCISQRVSVTASAPDSGYKEITLEPITSLYAWTIESGSSVSPSSASTFYTTTLDPVFDLNNAIYPEFYDANGISYGTAAAYSAIMSWILTKNGSSYGETYVSTADSSKITLNAIGPA